MSRLMTLVALAFVAGAQQPYSTLPQSYWLACEHDSADETEAWNECWQ
jgi:hypothetical protein